jgi:hypothetical protein
LARRLRSWNRLERVRPAQHQQTFIVAKVALQTRKTPTKHYDPFICGSQESTACGTQFATVSIIDVVEPARNLLPRWPY